MKVGILLLSADGYYVDEDGFLPARPDFDKKLLLGLCNNQTYICSPKTLETLPLSLLMIGEKATSEEYDINLGVKTLYTLPPHLLIVVRSNEELKAGKKFDLTGFRQVYDSNDLELYILRTISE